jgi:CRISPR-associated exonuclease Cas4
MPFLAIALILLSLWLFRLANQQRRSSGVPNGRITYTDTRNWGKLEKPLYDASLGLTGKPDYLVKRLGKMIPVEVKTGRTPNSPYESHILQLAAYCRLVEQTYHQRPPNGILHYPERDFLVDYDARLESSLLDRLSKMRQDNKRYEVPRSHEEPGRCQNCGFRSNCDQKLG